MLPDQASEAAEGLLVGVLLFELLTDQHVINDREQHLQQ